MFSTRTPEDYSLLTACNLTQIQSPSCHSESTRGRISELWDEIWKCHDRCPGKHFLVGISLVKMFTCTPVRKRIMKPLNWCFFIPNSRWRCEGEFSVNIICWFAYMTLRNANMAVNAVIFVVLTKHKHNLSNWLLYNMKLVSSSEHSLTSKSNWCLLDKKR